MRKWILLPVLLFITAAAYSQPMAEEPAYSFEQYIKKSKRQNTAGWILTTAGTAGLLTTLVKDMNQSVSGLFVSVVSVGTAEPEYQSYTNYYVASGVALAAGILTFSAARHNKRKAAALQTSIKMEQAPVLYSNGIGRKACPSLSLRVAL